MRSIVSFSARMTGNCADIARYIAAPEDRVVHYDVRARLTAFLQSKSG